MNSPTHSQRKKQTDFLDSLVDKIEKLNLRAGGGHDSLLLDWIIDYSDSSLNKGEIIDRIGNFLMSKDDLISNYKIK